MMCVIHVTIISHIVCVLLLPIEEVRLRNHSTTHHDITKVSTSYWELVHKYFFHLHLYFLRVSLFCLFSILSFMRTYLLC